MKKSKFKKAFTIPELLVIIAVIGIIASGLVLVWVQDARAKARDAKRVSDLEAIRTALQLYYMDNNSYPLEANRCCLEKEVEVSGECSVCKNIKGEIAPYLSQIPKDPLFGKGKEPGFPDSSIIYSYQYLSDGQGKNFKLEAHLEKAGMIQCLPGMACFQAGVDVVLNPGWGGAPWPAPFVYFEQDSYSVSENDEFATITLRLSRPFSSSAKVYYETQPLTAQAGSDYYATSGVLTFPANSQEAFFNIKIIDDDIQEEQETVKLLISNPMENCQFGDPANGYFKEATLYISDNDNIQFNFAPVSYSVGEGDGSVPLAISLSSPDPDNEITVRYYTATGTASENDFDFIEETSPREIIFEKNVISKNISINIIEDDILEEDEFFYVFLLDSTLGTIGPHHRASVTIIDNDILKTFIRKIHGNKDHGNWDFDKKDVFYSVQTTSDGYIMAGITETEGYAQEDILAVKIKKNGEIEWTKVIGSVTSDKAFAIEKLNDGHGGYVLTGETNSITGSDYDIFLIKITPDGEIQSQKFIVDKKGVFDSANDIAATPDGNIVIVGTTQSYSDGGEEEILIAKFDPDLNLIWAWTLLKPGFDSRGLSIKIASNGNYIITGTTIPSPLALPSSMNVVLFEISEDVSSISIVFEGEISGGQDLGGTKGKLTDIARSAIKTKDGDYVFVGSTESFVPHLGVAPTRGIYIVKIRASGAIPWDKKIVGTSDFQLGEGYSVLEKTDENYIIGGYVQIDSDITKAYLAEIDKETGDIIGQSLIQISDVTGNNHDKIYNSTESFDEDSFIVVGSVRERVGMGPHPLEDGFIAKIKDRQINCNTVFFEEATLQAGSISSEIVSSHFELKDIYSNIEIKDDLGLMNKNLENPWSENPCTLDVANP